MDKKQAWKDLDNLSDDLMSFCSNLIKIPSENPPGNVEGMVDFLTSYFAEHNIEFEVIRATEGHPNIIARYGSKEGKKLIFNGHCDVVPAGDLTKWNFDPFGGEIFDGKIHGRGTSDMKCGLGGSIYAMTYLADHKVPLNGEIVITCVPDEETGGTYGTKWLFDNGYIEGDWAVVAEPTGRDNIEVGQRASLRTTVNIKGKPAHGSLSPYVGDNAIEKMIDFLEKLKELRNLKGNISDEMQEVMDVSKKMLRSCHDVEGIENAMDHVSVNYGTIKGGVKSNMVAESAEAEIDIRIPLGLTATEVKKKINEIIEESNIKGITVNYDGSEKGNYVSTSDPICISAFNNAKELMGIDITMSYQWASSDARFFREHDISTIQYGPSDTEGIHNFNETATVSDVIDACKMYAGIMLDLLG